MYRVIKEFADLTDNNHIYRVGDAFPRVPYSVSDERIRELASSDNKTGEPLIELEGEEEEPEDPKPKRKGKKKK